MERHIIANGEDKPRKRGRIKIYDKERIATLVAEFIKNSGLRNFKISKVREYLEAKLIG